MRSRWGPAPVRLVPSGKLDHPDRRATEGGPALGEDALPLLQRIPGKAQHPSRSSTRPPEETSSLPSEIRHPSSRFCGETSPRWSASAKLVPRQTAGRVSVGRGNVDSLTSPGASRYPSEGQACRRGADLGVAALLSDKYASSLTLQWSRGVYLNTPWTSYFSSFSWISDELVSIQNRLL